MTIKVSGLKSLNGKLNRVVNLRGARRPMERSLALLQDDLASYPRKAAGAFSRTATPGQRRAYWARVKAGQISHREGIGYVRSGTLGRKWTSRVTESATGIQGRLGNNAGYGVYVQGERQQPFHRISGFTTVKESIQRHTPRIMSIWRQFIRGL